MLTLMQHPLRLYHLCPSVCFIMSETQFRLLSAYDVNLFVAIYIIWVLILDWVR
jgi:hypothetical protein